MDADLASISNQAEMDFVNIISWVMLLVWQVAKAMWPKMMFVCHACTVVQAAV